MNEIPPLDRKGLRDFGLKMGAAIAGLLGLVVPLLLRHALPPWPWMLGGTLAVLGLVAPQGLNPVYYGWMRVANVLEWINSRLTLGLIFIVAVTPMALVMRAIGRDTMTRQFEPSRPSYRIPSKARSRISMEKPY